MLFQSFQIRTQKIFPKCADKVDTLKKPCYNIYTQLHTGGIMKMFVIGTVFGIMVVTVGFGGMAKILDNGIQKVQEVSKEAAK